MIHESIRTIAVLGLGTMGHGIAQSFAAAGWRVKCYDEVAAARQSLHPRIRGNLERMAMAELVERPALPAILERCVVCASEAETLHDADFVTEAVAEDLAIKQALFQRIETLVKPETILASNSSSYPISQSAERLRQPERAVVTHWFNPPHIVPVVEVVPGQKTAQSVTQTTCELLKRIGKTPIRINQEIPGFLVNRVQIASMREVFDLLERGIASAEEIDAAIQGSMGLRLAALGPLQIIDFAGLDITGKVYQNLVTDLRSDRTLPGTVQERLDTGRFGAKTGEGFFRYTPEILEQKQAERDRRYLELIKLLHHE
jgi:3-hydroxyacyl-CoA dehydrogenase